MSRPRRRLPGLLALALVSALAPLPAAGAPAESRGAVTALPGEVVFGVPTPDEPSVALLVYERMECTATLIGCRTALTAAHCLCYDPAFDPPRLRPGDDCREHPTQLDPAGKRLFFQHAGWFEVESLEIHPGWDESGSDDLAVLHLDREVTGVRPAEINDLAPVPNALSGQIVAFGRTLRERADQGIKRVGDVVFGKCGGDFLCWWLLEEPAADDSRAGLCFHDSGGAVFAEPAGGTGGAGDRRLVGVNHSTTSQSCRAPSFNLVTDVYSRRDWIAATAGADLGPPDPDPDRGCGGLPAAGGAEGRVRGVTGRLSDDRPEAGVFVEVPAGTGVLRITMTATGRAEPADNDFDLYVSRGLPPDPEDPARRLDCVSAGPSGIEACEILAPRPGPWYALVRRVRGEGQYQLVATQLDGAPPAEPEEPEEPEGPENPGIPGSEVPAPPPELPWIAGPGLPGFEAKVRIGTAAGAPVADCVAEALCVSGALAGRAEVFVKVVGPRPNGHLWVQVARFTPSPVEIWLRRTATGRVNHYRLDPAGPASAGLPGLQDRRAFPE